MNLIHKLGMVQSDTKASKIFITLVDPDFRNTSFVTPHEYVEAYWKAYKTAHPSATASLNGNMFEIIIKTLLYKEGVLPYYSQARAAFVPNINYDVLLYSKSEPVSLSLKTSLRERYKQADLEAVALKYVHRKSECYLLTIDKNEASGASAKITSGDILGLNEIVYCFSDELDNLICKLKSRIFSESEKVEVIEGALVKLVTP